MTYKEIDNIKEKYKKYCDSQESCKYCKLNKNDCLIDFVYQLGIADGYSRAENDYHKQTENDRQIAYDCGYEQGMVDAIDGCINDRQIAYQQGIADALKEVEQLKGEE